MRAKAFAAIAATVALSVFAPAAGAAKTKTFHEDAHVFAELSGKATHGFTFTLVTFDRSAILSLSGSVGNLGATTVDYSAFNRPELRSVTNGRINLEIGDRGHFRGRFVTKSTRTEKPEGKCTGDPSTTEEGYFAGSFVFHGERGYTAVQAPRVRGAIIRRGAVDCQIPAGPGRRSEAKKEAKELAEKAAAKDEYRLVAGDRKGDLVLQATREQVPPGSKSTASIFEVTAEGPDVGAFHVSRSAFVFDTPRGAGSSFLTPDLQEPLAEATIEPPAPFSGSGTFQLEGAKKASWTGDLAVELPGAGKLPLAGKGLYAGTCRGRTDCTETLPKPLAEILKGSGGFSDGTATVETQTIS